MTTFKLDTHERPDGGAQVELSGELDLASAPKLDEELQRLEGDGLSLLVVDLSRLSFMDSSGLRALLAADTRAREAGHRFVLIRGDDRVQRVLAITRLDERLEIVDDGDSIAG